MKHSLTVATEEVNLCTCSLVYELQEGRYS